MIFHMRGANNAPMDIATYRKEKGLSQQAFADLLTASGSPATQGLVSQWESGDVRVPPSRWPVISKITQGQVTAQDLHPEAFGIAAGGQAAA